MLLECLLTIPKQNVEGRRSNSEVRPLQEDLKNIYQWVESNRMVLNSEEFSLLTYGCEGNDVIDSIGNQMPISLQVKDLGIITQSNGKYTEHIQDQSQPWLVDWLRVPTPMRAIRVRAWVEVVGSVMELFYFRVQ